MLPLGDPHAAAATGESVIAVILGTLVGIFTIAVGVGPRTEPDVAYHVAISGVLVVGLVVASRRLT